MDRLHRVLQVGIGFFRLLRLSITTYLESRRPEWVETQKVKIAQLIPTFAGAIIAARPILEKRKREREEQEKRHREEEARRYEARRLREVNEKRWNKLREYAVNWDERQILLKFLAEIEARLADEDDIAIADRTLREWVGWAKANAEALNPFSAGVAGLFQAIAKTTQWS